MRLRTFEYRHAETILNANFQLRREIERVLYTLELNPGEWPRKRTFAPAHRQIQEAFKKKGWQSEVLVTSRTAKRHYFDLYKDRVAIEIEISSRERLYRDYLRFLLAEMDGRIDVGVLLLLDNDARYIHPAGVRLALPRLEDVVDDLKTLRTAVGVPIWAVAIC